ncbi:MAG: TIM barrel protein [Fibrobacteres bacterium]|nr:TIM barrel protein [Fibrobacterota bacterium]
MEITFVCQPFNDDEFAEGLAGLSVIGYKRIETKDRRIRTFGVDGIGDLLTKNKMSIIQINTYFDVVSSDASAEKSIELNREMIDYAVKLSVPFIRVFTGPITGETIGSDKATPEIWKRAGSTLNKICSEGAKHNISYAVETHHHTLAENTPSIMKLLEVVDSKNFHVNLQLPLKGEADVYESTRILAPFVKHTHLNNFAADGHNTFLEEGVIDIRREIDILRKAGFDGALSVEHAYHHKPVLMVAKREFEFLTSIIS